MAGYASGSTSTDTCVAGLREGMEGPRGRSSGVHFAVTHLESAIGLGRSHRARRTDNGQMEANQRELRLGSLSEGQDGIGSLGQPSTGRLAGVDIGVCLECSESLLPRN